MTSYQNKEVKKYLVFAVLFSLGAAVVLCCVVLGVCSHYKRVENEAICALLKELVRQDPEADLQRFMEILNGNGNPAEDGNVEKELARYGISGDVYFIGDMQKAQQRIVMSCVLGVLLTEGILILSFAVYLRRRQRQLNQLSGYMDRIVLGQYDLDLQDNSEDELSNLKNQLFKITLTMREQATESREQKKALADSVSDISHQLKTPLTSASILLDNLNDSPDMEEETRKRFIREIARQVQSMNWMILSILKLSRLDAGVVEFEMEHFSLERMQEEAAENLEMIAELKSVRMMFPERGTAEPVMLYGDYNWNREAFQNILKNAIEHSPAGGQVWVKTEDNGVYTAITVTNEGKTISPEEQKQIFVRHYSNANSSENNMGIGLPLAKAILERQNGYITVESADGKTSFTMKYLKI